MEKRFCTAKKAVKEAGDFLYRSFGREKVIAELERDVKLVQDTESEKIILSAISGSFPEDGIVAEESGLKKSFSGYTWIIDPLDGTVNYSRRIPHAAISLACRRNGETVFGIIYDFIRDEFFHAEKGKGAYLGNARIAVSKISDMKSSIGTFGLIKESSGIASGLKLLNSLAVKIKKVRMSGSAALDLAYLACGRVDFVLQSDLKEWDYAAGRLIIEEAGGLCEIKDFNGKELFAATNGCLSLEQIYGKKRR